MVVLSDGLVILGTVVHSVNDSGFDELVSLFTILHDLDSLPTCYLAWDDEHQLPHFHIHHSTVQYPTSTKYFATYSIRFVTPTCPPPSRTPSIGAIQAQSLFAPNPPDPSLFTLFLL